MDVVFKWVKSKSGYEWENCEDSYIWAFPRESVEMPTGPYLVEKDLSQDREFLTPFENAALFAHFADIEGDAAAFEEWAYAYGMLTTGEKIHGGQLQVISKNARALGESAPSTGLMVVLDGKKNICGRLQPSESLPFWLVEHRDLSFAVQVWELAVNNDIERLGKILYWVADNSAVYMRYLKGAALDKDVKDLKDFRDTAWSEGESAFGGEILFNNGGIRSWALDLYRAPDIVKPALLYVQKTINEKLQKYPVNIVLQIDERGELQQKLQPSSLLAALWYQFHLVLAGKEKIRRCAICGLWEDMKGHRDTWKVHAKCASNKRVERFRKA